MKSLIIKSLQKAGIQIKRYPDFNHVRRMKIVNSFGIDVLFDIGANTGQYALKMRELGYKNKIISFEPLKCAFEYLKTNSLHDDNWIVNNYAIGKYNIKSSINVSENSYSSSILNMLPKHIESDPNSKFIGKEEIEIKKLDSIFNLFCDSNEKNIMLKIDTQGYEKNVIDGAINSLKKVQVIQLEMSLVPLYENEMLFKEMIEQLESKGFMLFSLENGFSNIITGQLLQVDGIFIKNLR